MRVAGPICRNDVSTRQLRFLAKAIADYVAELCKNTVGFLLLGLMLPAINTKHVKLSKIAAYEELGTESIKKLYF